MCEKIRKGGETVKEKEFWGNERKRKAKDVELFEMETEEPQQAEVEERVKHK